MKTVVVLTAAICATASGAVQPIVQQLQENARSAGRGSYLPRFTADGRQIIFLSSANDITLGTPDDDWLRVYAHDLTTSNNVLVSTGLQVFGAGNANCAWPAVSSNGQVIAFVNDVEVRAANVGEFVARSEVFIRDVAAKTTKLAVKTNHVGYLTWYPRPLLDVSGNPMLSMDGRWLFFESTASNIVTTAKPWLQQDKNLDYDVFRLDLMSNVTTLVSRRHSSEEAAELGSRLASITADGRRVAFLSRATNIVHGVTNLWPLQRSREAYVADLDSGIVRWVSPDTKFARRALDCKAAVLSEDGRFVVVLRPDIADMLYRFEIETGTTLLVASNGLIHAQPQISANGRYVLYEDGTNVYRWDGNTGEAELVSRTVAGTAPISGYSRWARMTSNGNGVLFVSNSPELIDGYGGGLFQIYARDMTAGITRLVTATVSGEPSRTSHIGHACDVSSDFSKVTFESEADDLVPGDYNRAHDIFVRDLNAGITVLVSTRHESYPAPATWHGHAFASPFGISSNGQTIAFTRWDSDLAPENTDSTSDVFVSLPSGEIRRLGIHTTHRVRAFALSGDGRYLIYAASSTNGAREDLFRYDVESDTKTFLLSGYAKRGDQPVPAITFTGDTIAYYGLPGLIVFNVAGRTNEVTLNGEYAYGVNGADASFSANDRFVIYVNHGGLFAWDRMSGLLRQIGFPAGSDSFKHVSVSPDSDHITYIDSASARLFWCDLITKATLDHGLGYRNARLGRRGTLIAASYGNEIRLLDAIAGTFSLVSIKPTGYSGGASREAALSSDGRIVAFLSTADTPAARTNRTYRRLVLRDRLLGRSTLVDVSPDGLPSNASSGRPMFSADGHTLIFESIASNLMPGDYNDRIDIFRVRLGVDSDADGIDDEWEVAYFGDLSRDGSSDFDLDGASDKSEFLAGTDPLNSGSIFAVRVMASLTSGTRVLSWNGDPARTYRVEYKDDLTASNWTVLDGMPVWDASTARLVDTTLGAIRFYRVVRLP